jgi:hypothetical protein
VGQDVSGQPERRLDHDPLDVREPVGGELGQRRDELQPGAVDQHVGLARRSVHSRRIAEVEGESRPADLVRHLLRGRLVAVEHGHGSAGRGEPVRAGAPDAAAAAGDQGRAAGQVELHDVGRHGSRT